MVTGSAIAALLGVADPVILMERTVGRNGAGRGFQKPEFAQPWTYAGRLQGLGAPLVENPIAGNKAASREEAMPSNNITYRTRKNPTLRLISDPHTYESAEARRVMVKVIDIFGNDTTKLLDVAVP